MHTGRCECGGVAFRITGDPAPATACHCTQCRRLSGHYWAGAWVRTSALTFTRDDTLAWYDSSDWARRGFCRRCGASLFYQLRDDKARISVGVGCLDTPTGTRLHRHIYVADKGDYYDIADGLPQLEEH